MDVVNVVNFSQKIKIKVRNPQKGREKFFFTNFICMNSMEMLFFVFDLGLGSDITFIC